MSYPHTVFDPASIPLGYLITFRAHGTWLHGDLRGSVDRFCNQYGTPRIPPNPIWRRYNEHKLQLAPIKLASEQRAAIDEAVRETCAVRRWELCAHNVRTNHVHAVVAGLCDPEVILRALKANATRKMREAGCWMSSRTPWARKGSKRWLWTYEQLMSAILYVKYEQGEPLR